MPTTRLSLPARLIPSEINENWALVICDGPSIAEFDAESIENCKATKYSHGRAWQQFKIDHQILRDPAKIDIIEHKRDFHLHVHPEIVNFLQSQDRMPDKHVSLLHTPHAVGLSLALQHGWKNIAVIGLDGYINQDGTDRAFIYNPNLQDNQQSKEIKNKSNPKLLPIYNTQWQTRTYVDIHNKLSADIRVYLLSPQSWYSNIFPLHVTVAEQPFAKIYRQGTALIFKTQSSSRWERGPRHSMNDFATYLQNFRIAHSHQAIFVKSTFTLSDLDIVFGELEIENPQEPLLRNIELDFGFFNS